MIDFDPKSMLYFTQSINTNVITQTKQGAQMTEQEQQRYLENTDRDNEALAKLYYLKAVRDGYITDPDFESFKTRIWSEYDYRKTVR